MIYVCPLARLEDTVHQSSASHVVSVMESAADIDTPVRITAANHLRVGCHDIVEPLGDCILPSDEHVQSIIDFAKAWPREQPIVIHCWAGISRSTATAYIIANIHTGPGREREIAQALRAASPTATPNGRIVAIADDLLGREGRMREAIAEIGRGELAFAGEPFMLAY